MRRWYVNNGPTAEGRLRYATAVAMHVCPFHGVRVGGRRRVWCGLGGQTAEGAVSCYWLFRLRYEQITDWKEIRARVLERAAHRCAGCRGRATEVDHIVEIQDGGPEFDLSNLQALCHRCHVAKTNATRFWRRERAVRDVARPKPRSEKGLGGLREDVGA